ncbi:hypothetical protein [Parasediminibacterium sp. JCM 36343]|uniref:hypothetical protein n=1 Tax=Parasediminibacterium sp. JCM 36343 TaxID=3374279 RepID=UPI00397E69E4
MLSAKIQVALETAYTKSNLETGLYKLVKAFYAANSNTHFDGIDYVRITEIFNTKKAKNRAELALVCFSVFSNEIVYKAFLASLPASLVKAIEKLLWNDGMDDKQLTAFLKHPITESTGSTGYYSYSSKELLPAFYFFTVKELYNFHNNDRPSFFLFLHPEVKKVLVNYYPKPRHYYLVPIEKPLETVYRFNAEPLILDELPRLISYYLQGNIKYTANGRPMESTLGKLQKSCAIAEFYPSDIDGLNKIRSCLLAGVLYGFSQKNLDLDSVDIIKTLFNKQYFKSYSSKYILNHLKGWGFVSDEYEMQELTEQTLYEVFKEMTVGSWISDTNLIELTECRSLPVKPISETGAGNRLYIDIVSERGYSDKAYIGSDTYPDFILNPYIQGTVFLYASLGLLEIAYTGVDASVLGGTYFSPYDGLMYFRLTKLGAYIFGKTPTYEAEGGRPKNEILLSEDSMMIIANGNMDVIEVMLNNYSEKVGSNRFRITSKLFLKDCKNKKDIENKIALLKKTVNTTFPAYWNQFFDDLIANATAVKANKLVQVFTLPATSKELHRLVAQDSVLKQVVQKAEGFNLLVTNENAAKFKNRMKELGYLVE